jgi:hypothetical protein
MTEMCLTDNSHLIDEAKPFQIIGFTVFNIIFRRNLLSQFLGVVVAI